MPIKFNCHNCGAKLRVPEHHIGKKARCPKCDEKNVVPETSVRGVESALGGNFEDMGSFLDQPAAAPIELPPAVGIPVASPTAPQPAMATPAAPPLPSSVPQPTYHSPYATPLPQKKRRGGGRANSGSVVKPLYEARIFIRIFGWAMFIIGIIHLILVAIQMLIFLFAGAAAALGPQGRPGSSASGLLVVFMLLATIIGLIVPIVTTWIGWQIKCAESELTIGVESGDNDLVRSACQRFASYFRIMGIVGAIALVFMAILLLITMIGFLGALVAR